MKCVILKHAWRQMRVHTHMYVYRVMCTTTPYKSRLVCDFISGGMIILTSMPRKYIRSYNDGKRESNKKKDKDEFVQMDRDV